MIDFETLAPDSRAIILLCTSLGADVGAGLRPLGAVTWSRLDDALRRQSFQGANVRMPDALVLSSAIAISATQLVTNDRSPAAAAGALGIGTCLLAGLR